MKPYLNSKLKDCNMSQVVEHLPSKCEAWSLNPSTTKKEKEEKIIMPK
jgi:hypothetical protein